MKPLIILILSLVIVLSSKGQYKFPLKQKWPVLATQLLAGASEGTMDYLQFHYSKNNQFWNPDISWTNKYKHHSPEEGLTFRGKWLVFTTDGWHLMKFSNHLFTSGSIALVCTGWQKKKFWEYILDGLIYWATNRIGFISVYNTLKAN